jgi:hypothetical protein
MSFVVGRKYRYKTQLPHDPVFTCVGLTKQLAVLAYPDGHEFVTQLNGNGAYYVPYVAPIKPFRIRTVAVVNTVTGSLRVASITDNHESHRVDDPTWPTGWGLGNETRVYDVVVEVKGSA